MDIQPVSRADREVWVAFRCALWPDAAADHAADVDRFFGGDRREPAEVLLAWEDGRAIGFVELSLRNIVDGCRPGSVGYLEGWYVAPHARGRGVGRALVDAGQQWARSKGCAEFGSDAEISNEASIAAHRALGFQETSRGVNFRKTIGAVMVALAMSGAAAIAQHALSTREFFYVGGKYSGEGGGEVMAGQMYVEALKPARVTRPYPLVFFHGAGQTATNWMATPDGRAGWADYFLTQGYVVYLVDQPARGRSPWRMTVNGPLQDVSVTQVEQRFTAPEDFDIWPQAKLHTQWPGDGDRKGMRGDPIFDAFYATQVPSLASAVETQTLVQSAGAALLDRIGPAVIVTHSQAGPFGWLLADVRPAAVKGIIAVEPNGPPFQNAVTGEEPARAWGIADIPLTYDPPVRERDALKRVRETDCWRQSDPPHTLPKLRNIPILIVTGEASYHAVYDHCTSEYLTQAGVPNTFTRLESVGIHGNGHMMMLEKNSTAVAAYLEKWLTAHVR
ncbi:MAG TPA: GNAT family N-acetyltransferase [Vicinamibacterales bacterium]|nr:GNAT family N-acetyltransferase [Vicinamibacterales bacterium]